MSYNVPEVIGLNSELDLCDDRLASPADILNTQLGLPPVD